MARTRDEIETEIRAQTPEIVVTDGAQRAVYVAGDPEYEAWLTRTVEAHVAAEAEAGKAEAERAQLAPLLAKLDGGGSLTAAEQRTVFARLLRREMGAPPNDDRSAPQPRG